MFHIASTSWVASSKIDCVSIVIEWIAYLAACDRRINKQTGLQFIGIANCRVIIVGPTNLCRYIFKFF